MPVCDFKGVLLGIISERDIIKWLHRGNADTRTQVKDVMTDKVVTADSEDDVETALKIMTEKGIRHLPIMTGTRVVGMVSLRDVADEKLAEHALQINVLKEYIPEITLKPVAR
jgi:CBS domain-containing protein